VTVHQNVNALTTETMFVILLSCFKSKWWDSWFGGGWNFDSGHWWHSSTKAMCEFVKMIVLCWRVVSKRKRKRN